TASPISFRHSDHPYLHSFPTRRSSDLRYTSCSPLHHKLPGRRAPRRRPHPQNERGKDARKGLVSAQVLLCAWLRLARAGAWHSRSEEHTSELQSRGHLVCRLLLEKKK